MPAISQIERSVFLLVNAYVNPIYFLFGVPQGSIREPLLFLFYINGIVRSSDLLKFIISADNTNLFLSNIDLKTLISNVHDELIKV